MLQKNRAPRKGLEAGEHGRERAAMGPGQAGVGRGTDDGSKDQQVRRELAKLLPEGRGAKEKEGARSQGSEAQEQGGRGE